jgi:competence transcription factor ComK
MRAEVTGCLIGERATGSFSVAWVGRKSGMTSLTRKTHIPRMQRIMLTPPVLMMTRVIPSVKDLIWRRVKTPSPNAEADVGPRPGEGSP